MNYDAAAWHEYFVAQAGAAAVFAGLIFVAVSINLREILRFPQLPGRVAEALIALVQLLVVAMIVLIPDQSARALGAELLIIGVVVVLSLLTFQLQSLRAVPAGAEGESAGSPRARVLIASQVVGLPVILAGATLVAHAGGGLYWLAAGTGLAVVAGITDAWVLLIEILR